MIIMPNSYRHNQLSAIDSWSVYGLKIGKQFGDIFFEGCDSVYSGVAKLVRLSNLNGKYIKISQSYKGSPVYFNINATKLVTGPGFGTGTNFFALNQYERSEIEENTELYTTFRDGPYLLGKFGKNATWAIIKLPQSFDNSVVVELSDIDISSWSDEEIENSIVLSQYDTLPPTELNDTYLGSNKNKRYSAWQNKTSPLSRDWEINQKLFVPLVCESSSKTKIKIKSHMSSNSSTVTNPADISRQQPRVANGTPMYKKVFTEYQQLLASINNGIFGDDDTYILIPQPLNLFSVNLTTDDDDDYTAGVFKDLGNFDNDTELTKILYLTINGQFINTKTTRSILNGVRYKILSVDVTTEWDESSDPSVVNIDAKDFNTKLDNTTKHLINWVENTLSEWAVKTAFLYPPAALKNSWLDAMQSYIVINDQNDINAIYKSDFTNKYLFTNYYLAKYYDRLYEFMSIGG